MNANENTRTAAPEDVIELGVASVETKGQTGPGEFNGIEVGAGISEE